MEKHPFVYIVTNERNGTLYVGVTSDLPKRIWQHRASAYEGFSKRHGCIILVWFEEHQTMEDAIVREKCIKKWNRAWKIRMIQERNPQWNDHFEEICR